MNKQVRCIYKTVMDILKGNDFYTHSFTHHSVPYTGGYTLKDLFYQAVAGNAFMFPYYCAIFYYV